MNANRMKYATTPTYGMQRRGLFKKPAAAYQAPGAPDFALATEQTEIPQPFPVISQPGAMNPVPQPQINPFPQSPYFPPNLSIPSMQTLNSSRQPICPPYMNTTAQPPVNQQGYAAPQGFMPPLGNSAPPINPVGNAFSPRNQGYVPPAGIQPTVQSAPFAGTQPLMGGVPLVGAAPRQQPIQPMQPIQQMQPARQNQPAAGYQTAPQTVNPLFAAAPARPQMPGYPYGAPQKQPKAREPMDADKIWSIFIFAALPAVFVACLFLPESLSFVRYFFLALCVGGLGAMWYRRMFTSSTRFIISVVYVALCVVTIAMSMQGSRDAQQTLGPVSPQSRQATVAPDAVQTPVPDVAVTEAPPSSEPTPHAPSEAENRLSAFMTLWMGMNTPEMVSYVQPSWASAQENPSSQLFMVLANRTPESFEIEEISGTDDDSSRTVIMTAVINKNNGKESVMYRFMVLMIKEGGEWYVDPNSLATSDDVKTTDENVVNVNEVASGLSTEPPRTTVSPAPPADTKLYYNPDGGHYYHLDPNCPSVKDEYLPLPGSFLYSELKSHSDLTPCLKCGAPTKALEDSE